MPVSLSAFTPLVLHSDLQVSLIAAQGESKTFSSVRRGRPPSIFFLTLVL